MSFFTDRLKDLQVNRGVLKKDIAKSLGISIMAYYRYETGDREPTVKTLMAIADYFGVPTDYLLGSGLYAHKDLILENLDSFCKPFQHMTLENGLTFIEYLQSLDDIGKIKFLDAFVDKVEVTEDNSMKIFYKF